MTDTRDDTLDTTDLMRRRLRSATAEFRAEAKRQFEKALASHQLSLSGDLIADGKFHRCDATNKPGHRGKNDGAYVLHLDGVPRGTFINYTTDATHTNWTFKGSRPLTEAEQRELAQTIEAAKTEAQASREASEDQARKDAKKIWDDGAHARSDHPYAVRKKVEPNRLRTDDKCLLVPLFSENEELQSLQYIYPNGKKLFQEGGRTKGCHYWVSKPNRSDSETLVVCEGWATGQSIYQATGYTVLMAFTRGNLRSVAKWAREKFPKYRLIVAADDDWKTDGNPGRTPSCVLWSSRTCRFPKKLHRLALVAGCRIS